MRIAYFSPFNPLRSGISDFSEELVMELREHLEIDLFVDNYIPSNPSITEKFKFFDINVIHRREVREQYDYLIFHVGNCREFHEKIVNTFMTYGGILELHDISLFHYWCEAKLGQKDNQGFIDIMKYCHGSEGERVALGIIDQSIKERWGTLPQKFILNKPLIERADAIIVHSDMAKQIVKAIRPSAKVINITHHTSDIIENYKEYKKKCREELNIKKEDFIIASFGIASSSKRIIPIMEAVKLFNEKKKKKIYFYIVGEIKENNILESIKKLKLQETVIITGYVELDKFKTYMGASDIITNLRFPTQGESSGSLHRALGMGKPVIVTDIGSFSEYPDDVVLKVRYDSHEVADIFEALKKVVLNDKLKERYERNALEYAIKNCSLKNNAIKYKDFVFGLFYKNFREENNIENLTDHLMFLNLTDEEYMNNISKKLDIGIEW